MNKHSVHTSPVVSFAKLLIMLVVVIIKNIINKQTFSAHISTVPVRAFAFYRACSGLLVTIGCKCFKILNKMIFFSENSC